MTNITLIIRLLISGIRSRNILYYSTTVNILNIKFVLQFIYTTNIIKLLLYTQKHYSVKVIGKM